MDVSSAQHLQGQACTAWQLAVLHEQVTAGEGGDGRRRGGFWGGRGGGGSERLWTRRAACKCCGCCGELACLESGQQAINSHVCLDGLHKVTTTSMHAKASNLSLRQTICCRASYPTSQL